MLEGPFSLLIFLCLATLADEGYKASTKSFVVRCYCFDIQAVVDFWVIVRDLQRRLAFR